MSPHGQGRDSRMGEIFIGIDIAKDSIEVYVLPSGEQQTCTTEDIEKIVEQMSVLEPDLIVMEATGGLEVPLAAELVAAELPVVVVNPRQVRDFARALGILAKTDAIDARVLALFAEKVRPEYRPLPSKDDRFLRELVARRRQLVEMRTMESNRQRRMRSDRVSESITLILDTINAELARLDNEIKSRIRKSPVWREKHNLLRSVPGIGDTTAPMLIVALPELGQLNRRQIASLAGLAPINRDSGTLRGRRMIMGGRAAVRTALYMPTLCAIRYNPSIKRYYTRLCEHGKPPKVAITACMRKLLTILNAVIHNNKPWIPQIS